jgi:farnesyl diphosphate synthase
MISENTPAGFPRMTSQISSSLLLKRLNSNAEALEKVLADLLSDAPLKHEIARPSRLLAAMRYGSLNGGKRFRPFLVVESASLFSIPAANALLVGASLECIHCYSLLHDDLPSMDNSNLRRGRLTVHKAFDEATAILAGDALLTLAFDIITRDEIHADMATRVLLTRELARVAGLGGMVGGQIMDLASEGRFDGDKEHDVETLQQMKTGVLLGLACRSGAILGGAAPAERSALDVYGKALGQAFQIADDLLDVESNHDALGKPVGQDSVAGKTTFVTLLGAHGARMRLHELVAEADAALDIFGQRAEMLKAAARYVAERQN